MLRTLAFLVCCGVPFCLAQVEPPTTNEVVEGEVVNATADASEPGMLIERLSPLNQIRVFTGLFTVVVLGVVIFIVIKAGAHMARGLAAAANRLPHDSSPKQDDWADTPLVQQPADSDSDNKAVDDVSND